jgi:hypothetical protein
MPAPQHPASSPADPDESLDGQPPPIPDEDGPHDVSDDKVIEKTLPAVPPSGSGRAGSPVPPSKPQGE